MNRTKIDALYDLAKKMSGTAIKDDSIVEMIDQVTRAYSGGGGSSNNGLITLHVKTADITTEGIAIANNKDLEQLESFYQGLISGATVSLENIMIDTSSAEDSEFGGIYYNVLEIYAYTVEGEEEAQIDIASASGSGQTKSYYAVERDSSGAWSIRKS